MEIKVNKQVNQQCAANKAANQHIQNRKERIIKNNKKSNKTAPFQHFCNNISDKNIKFMAVELMISLISYYTLCIHIYISKYVCTHVHTNVNMCSLEHDLIRQRCFFNIVVNVLLISHSKSVKNSKSRKSICCCVL